MTPLYVMSTIILTTPFHVQSVITDSKQTRTMGVWGWGCDIFTYVFIPSRLSRYSCPSRLSRYSCPTRLSRYSCPTRLSRYSCPTRLSRYSCPIRLSLLNASILMIMLYVMLGISPMLLSHWSFCFMYMLCKKSQFNVLSNDDIVGFYAGQDLSWDIRAM